ncbi:MAG: heme transporter CcmC [Nitrososphaera sp.]|uniref:heme transporter CcmC n=1 Tax=Nitrososphaera sp. TaxID=1971748 RepID=UPI00181765C4|nr:heme transporter CcmC [Nitrososphaera sp.]NWG37872.1 heme transporter CcmC [Nitrososphaera sp.]
MGISLRHAVILIVPVVVFSIIQPAFAQESDRVIINRVEVWGLFYKGMVIAFTIGAVIMGVIAYVVFRFRESNPKNIPRGLPEGHQ